MAARSSWSEREVIMPGDDITNGIFLHTLQRKPNSGAVSLKQKSCQFFPLQTDIDAPSSFVDRSKLKLKPDACTRAVPRTPTRAACILWRDRAATECWRVGERWLHNAWRVGEHGHIGRLSPSARLIRAGALHQTEAEGQPTANPPPTQPSPTPPSAARLSLA